MTSVLHFTTIGNAMQYAPNKTSIIDGETVSTVTSQTHPHSRLGNL